MKYLKNENFIVIQGWMVNELNLSGNNLIVYAIIYGFSHTENQKFTGSRQYLAEFTNSTPRGIQKNLDALVEKGFILKEDVHVNNVKHCHYECASEFIGGEQSSLAVNKVHGDSEQSSYNNIEIINSKEKNNKKEKISEDFKPDESLMKWVDKKFPKIPEPELLRQTELFIEHFIASGESRKSWALSWQKWIRNAVEWEKINYSNNGESENTPRTLKEGEILYAGKILKKVQPGPKRKGRTGKTEEPDPVF